MKINIFQWRHFMAALVLVVSPFVVKGQFTYVTNGDSVSITITGYTGPGGAVVIPNTVNGYNVTSIGHSAFMGYGLTNIVIPNSVTSIQGFAFFGCPLTSLTIPGHVTNIEQEAFFSCTNLTSVTIPASVTSIGQWAFASCADLTSVYFQGNAPSDDGTAFTSDHTIVYYLPGTTGWGSTFGDAPTQPWFLPHPTVLGFGLLAHRVSFTISWATNTSVVVQTCTNLANPNWIPVVTNTLINGTRPFLDTQLANDPGRFYRISTP